MKKIINSIIGLPALAALFLTACGSAPQGSDGTLRVLASTTFLADIAWNVAGDRVKVDSLLPVGADPHAYQAAPADVAKIAASNVLVLNGLEYEHFIEPLLENAGGERLVIEATTGLEPREMDEHAGEAEAGEGSGHEAGDPHMWLDPTLVIRYVENIRDGFIEADPEGAEVYRVNADAYIDELRALDAWITEQVADIPSERRLLVTNHEAMGYFAGRYGFEIVDTILASLSSDAGISAQRLAAVINEVKTSGAEAVFLDDVENTSLANQIAGETGIKVVGDLHLESLTDGAPAGTYIDMMKHNTTRIVDALK
ncbi:MAG: zinc ABC transporter substrate-binding protein [Anaerolineales bacterium]|nr:MAG: zinc ABC transporter substrate-binding protein [Anaerolineales bacterium]